MPSKRKARPKRQPEFRLRLTPADRKWHATVTKHAKRNHPSVGAFLRRAIESLYASETRPTVSSGPWVQQMPREGTVSYEWGLPIISVVTTSDPAPMREAAVGHSPDTVIRAVREFTADSLTHPEE